MADTKQQKFLVIEGEGGAGKSVVLNVLSGLVGEENVSHVPVEVFGERFQLTATVDMLLNIAPEVGDGVRIAEGPLKQFTGGDRMTFERKGLPHFQAYPTARLRTASGGAPRSGRRVRVGAHPGARHGRPTASQSAGRAARSTAPLYRPGAARQRGRSAGAWGRTATRDS